MSTENYTTYENLYVRNAIHNVVTSKQPKISDYVRRIANEKGLSYRKIAEKSGGLITHSTVSDVINERVKNLSSATITGLANGLGVTEQEIFDIVRGKISNNEIVIDEQFENLSLKFSGLPPSKKERAQALIELMDREIERLANEK